MLCSCMYLIAATICLNKFRISISSRGDLHLVKYCNKVPPSAYSISIMSKPSFSKLPK